MNNIFSKQEKPLEVKDMNAAKKASENFKTKYINVIAYEKIKRRKRAGIVTEKVIRGKQYKKACPYCGKIIVAGTKCPGCKQIERIAFAIRKDD